MCAVYFLSYRPTRTMLYSIVRLFCFNFADDKERIHQRRALEKAFTKV